MRVPQESLFGHHDQEDRSLLVGQNDQVEGTVFVDFVVGAGGAVRDAEVTEATNDAAKQAFSEEAIRVVSSMPAWTPGTQRGKPVDVRVSLPITFQLD